MLNGGTLAIAVWGALGIAGLLLALSRLRFERRLDWRIGIGIPLFGVSLFVLTTELPQYGIGFSILGTLIMAGAALMSIKQSDEQVKQHRKDELNKESRSRKERLRNEVLDWAIEVNSFALQNRTEAVEELIKEGFRPFLESQLTALFTRFEPFRSRSVYVSEIAPFLDERLKSGVENLINELRSQIEALHKYRSTKNTLAEDEKARELARTIAGNNSRIHNQAVALIKLIAESDVEDL